MSARDSFFDTHGKRLGVRFPQTFRRVFLARRLLSTPLRLSVSQSRLHLRFLAPDEWARTDAVLDADGFNLPTGVRGVVVAADGRTTVFLRAGAGGLELDEALWIWPGVGGSPEPLANDLAHLLERARQPPPEKQLEREATRLLHEAEERARAAKREARAKKRG